jgi:chromo domain-containing protein 1
MEDVPAEQPPVASITSQLNGEIERFYNLDPIEIFNSGIPDERSDMLERRAMLLYHPEEHTEEIELITRWLLMHEVEVGNLWYDGAWSHFQQEAVDGKTGVIIVRSTS